MDVNGVSRPVTELPVTSSGPVKPANPEAGAEGSFKPAEKVVAESQQENTKENEEKLKEAVDKLNKAAVIFDRSLRFKVHEETHRTMVSVVDIVKDKVIRQIPNEEVLDLVAKMQDYIGLIFDKKA